MTVAHLRPRSLLLATASAVALCGLLAHDASASETRARTGVETEEYHAQIEQRWREMLR